ncbi:23S rRNA (guanosine(2251)-2'-O)-methyltransferase RlmB [Basilea psittacipulmonis]|uniref:23S rRNA (guanosine-2'-O-)-methyltransferase RlmB n=1 Tax=Basilea psittacipulmonis DSM 24701 TaxID=1072685 RepID=A0A077DCK4_9BURK|nr:23S rRNA (guanosine(2251)-2'-O)-methyltransferase RlmB [Basilea psittacipulmonis]AIL32615.1 23S rRNA methyltransferase [Basilea psittacipulmonis DSM 24701]
MKGNKQLLAGFHSIEARLRHAPDSVIEVFIDVSRHDKRIQSLMDRLKQFAFINIHLTDSVELDKMVEGVRHQGVVAWVSHRVLATSVEELLSDLSGPAHLLVLDGVTDPHNLGACLRTADAAGVHAIIAPKDKSVGLTTTVQRVACGAAETVPYLMVTNLSRTLKTLKEHHIWVVGTTDQAEQSMFDLDLKMPIAWVMGAEGDGMRRLTKETCDELVRLPMMGTVESLNVSVASALCMYETLRQRKFSA